MATETHYIYSRNPGDSRSPSPELQEDPWLIEKPILPPPWLRAPRFVPATSSYVSDDFIQGNSTGQRERGDMETEKDGESIGGWYKSLTRKTVLPNDQTSKSHSEPTTPGPSQLRISNPKPIIDKNNWFISRVLHSEAEAENRSGARSAPPAETLVDKLSRNPPPERSEQPFRPPVWLAIGPGNKGFDMVRKSGWEEGESLGRTRKVGYRTGLGYKVDADADGLETDHASSNKGKGKAKVPPPSYTTEISVVHDGDIEELRRVEAIDLTLSDSSGDENEDEADSGIRGTVHAPSTLHDSNGLTPSTSQDRDMDHNPIALLTPIPTVLKNDRLGIGLKAKRVGPHRESLKRVTHSQAAIAAHIAAREKLKRTKDLVGRGRRGFQSLKKHEELDRKSMLAYLNTD